MATEFTRNARAPGIRVYERANKAKETGASTRLPGIEAQFRRGRTDIAVRVNSFSEAQEQMGSYYQGMHGPIQTDLYYQQENNGIGPTSLILNRVVGTGAVKGSLALKDSRDTIASAEDTLSFEALGEGEWINNCDVTTRRYSVDLNSDLSANSTSLDLSDITDVELGDLVQITDGTTTVYVYVRTITITSGVAGTITFKDTGTHATIEMTATTPASRADGLTAHRATSTLVETLNHNATQMKVAYGRTFTKGMRVLIDDPNDDRIVSGLVSQINGNYLQFPNGSPIQLLEEAIMTASLATPPVANQFTDNELVAFNTLGHNITDQVVAFTAGRGFPQSDRAVSAINTTTGLLTLDDDLEKDLGTDSEYTIGSAAKYVTVSSGLSTTSDGNGERAYAIIDIVDQGGGNPAYTDGDEAITVGPNTYNATGPGGFAVGTCAQDAANLVSLINADEAVHGLTSTIVDPLVSNRIIITAVSWDATVGDAVILGVTDAAVNENSFADELGTPLNTASGITQLSDGHAGTTPTTAVCTQLTAFENIAGPLCGLEACKITIGVTQVTCSNFDRATGTLTFANPGGVVPQVTSSTDFTIEDWTFKGGVDACTNNTIVIEQLKASEQFGEDLELCIAAGGSVDLPIEITGGTGVGYTSTITAFNSTTGLVTVADDWVDIPDATSVWQIGNIANPVPNVPYSITYTAGVTDTINVVSQEFHLLIYEDNSVVETHMFLSMESASDDYVETRLGGASNESILVAATNESSTIASTDPIRTIPQSYSRQVFSGGVEGTAPTDVQYITALSKFNSHKVTRIAIPGQCNAYIVDELRKYCENRGTCGFVTTSPQNKVTVPDAIQYRNQTLNYMSTSQGSMNAFWAEIHDPESTNPNAIIEVPQDGAILGAMSYIAEDKGIHYPAANLEMRGFVGMTCDVADGSDEAALLMANGVNFVIFDDDDGVYKRWLSRTMDRTGGRRQWETCREVLNYIIQQLPTVLKVYYQKPNLGSLGRRAGVSISNFLADLSAQGAFTATGSPSGNPYDVQDVTTATERSNGELNFVVDVFTTSPLERFSIGIGITGEGVEAREL